MCCYIEELGHYSYKYCIVLWYRRVRTYIDIEDMYIDIKNMDMYIKNKAFNSTHGSLRNSSKL